MFLCTVSTDAQTFANQRFELNTAEYYKKELQATKADNDRLRKELNQAMNRLFELETQIRALQEKQSAVIKQSYSLNEEANFYPELLHEQPESDYNTGNALRAEDVIKNIRRKNQLDNTCF